MTRAVGVGYADVRADEARALEEIVARYRALAAGCDSVLAVGTDYAGVGTADELAFNARVALNLGLPVLCVVSGHERTPEEVAGRLRRADHGARHRLRGRRGGGQPGPRRRAASARRRLNSETCPSTSCRRCGC